MSAVCRSRCPTPGLSSEPVVPSGVQILLVCYPVGSTGLSGGGVRGPAGAVLLGAQLGIDSHPSSNFPLSARHPVPASAVQKPLFLYCPGLDAGSAVQSAAGRPAEAADPLCHWSGNGVALRLESSGGSGFYPAAGTPLPMQALSRLRPGTNQRLGSPSLSAHDAADPPLLFSVQHHRPHCGAPSAVHRSVRFLGAVQAHRLPGG